MDLPATQAIDDEDFPSTQQVVIEEKNQNSVVGTLLINQKLHNILPGVTTIGRHPASKIVINHETISKRHAEIEAESTDGSIFIRDLNSCNKTKINNTKLRPNSSYQIKDGDKLVFGQVLALFKLYCAIDDSIVSCTPQVNRKLGSVIPDTPDSSINASSASESDVSAIIGTQTDQTDRCFRQPQVPVKSSMNSPRIVTFNLDDLPSPLSKTKTNNTTQSETREFSSSDAKEDFDDSIYNAETQQAVNTNKSNESDENIYEMETQRPVIPMDDVNDIENLETQVFDNRESDLSKRKSKDLSIYSAETQKVVVEEIAIDSIDNLETQVFDSRKSDSVKTKLKDVSIYSAETQKVVPDEVARSIDVSIYSAETQKVTPEDLADDCIHNLKTQAFDNRKSDMVKTKFDDVSLYSAETQKVTPEEVGNDCIDNLETQRFDSRKSEVVKTKLNDVSVCTAKTQIFDISNVDSKSRKSDNVSIYSAATQKNVAETLVNKSVENLEIEEFDNSKSDFAKRKSLNSSNFKMQKNVTEAMSAECLDNIETQQFDKTSENNKKQSHDMSTHSIETEKVVPDISTENELIENLETQQFDNRHSDKFQTPNIPKNVYKSLSHNGTPKRAIVNVSSVEDVETQQFIPEKSNHELLCSKEHLSKDQIDRPIEDLETQRFEDGKSINVQTLETYKKRSISKLAEKPVCTKRLSDEQIINKSVTNLEEQKSMNQNSDITNEPVDSQSTLSISVEDMETMPFINEKLEVSKVIEDTETQNPNELLSLDSGFRSIEQESDNSEKDQNTSNEKSKRPLLSSSLNEISRSSIVHDQSDLHDLKNDENNIHAESKEQSDLSSVEKVNELQNSDKVTNVIDDDDDDEDMFCSQNLIQDCPFAFLPDESEIDVNNITNTSNTTEETTEDKDKQNSNSDSISSRNNKSVCKAGDDEKNTSISTATVGSDSETDEEGIFASYLSKENENIINSNKDNSEIKNNENNKDDSETDEEGIFENYSTDKCHSKMQDSLKQNKKSPSPASKDSIFDENVNEKNNTDVATLNNSKPCNDADSSPTKKRTNNNEKDESVANIDEEIDELAPTQLVQRNTSETENMNDAPSVNNNLEDEFLAPTQIISRQNSLEENAVDEFDSLDLAPTQKINTHNSDACLSPAVDNQQPNDVINEATKNASIEDLDYEMAPTQIVDQETPKIINSSKRHLEEIEITCNKKLKVPNKLNDEETDLNNAVENDLDEMLGEGAMEPALEVEDKLSNQTNNWKADISISAPSPTLSTRKSARTRCRVTKLDRSYSSKTLEKTVVNLNDTIERNLKEIFNDSVNTLEAYESDSMMTQQLQNILESQTATQPQGEESNSKSLPLDPPASKAQAKEDKSRVVVKEGNTSQESNSQESQGTEEYFANLKSKKKCRTIVDSQSDDEASDNHSPKKDRIVYRRATIGFSSNLEPVSTSKRVALLEPASRSFTSDSQSDGDEFSGSQGSRTSSGKKRFNLSLSKSVNLNSSASGASDQEAEKPRIAGKAQATPSRRTQARGTRGFTNDNLLPVDSEELVSAASTESDEDEQLRQVGNISSTSLATEVAEEVDSDEDFLRSMPDIKVAGTAECPATNSQLAAPSDHEDLESVSSLDIVIPVKWTWYAQKRYDLIYKKDEEAKPTRREDEDIKVKKPASPARDPSAAIDEFIANLKPVRTSYKKRHSPSPMSEGGSSVENVNPRPTRSKRGSFARKSGILPDSLPRLAVSLVKLNPDKSFSKAATREENSDSDEPTIIPKYTPLEPMQLNLNFNSAMNRHDKDDSDQEFELLRQRCERMLAMPSVYASKKTERGTSPVLTGRRRKSALGNCSSLNVMRLSGTENKRRKSPDRTVDQDGLVFQVAEDSLKTTETPTSKTLDSTTSRNKRGAQLETDGSPNQPSKRIKKDNRKNYKLQPLSPPTPAKKTTSRKAPKTLDSYVMLQKGKTRKDSSDLSAVENSLTEDKNVKPVKAQSRAVSSRKVKAESSIVRGNSSSKENLVVEDSDVETTTRSSKTRGQRNKTTDLSVLVKDKSKDTSSQSSGNESARSTRGRATRQTQKADTVRKSTTRKVTSNVDSKDSDNKVNIKEIKSIKDSDSEKSDKTDNFVNKETRSRRVGHVKSSNLEKISKSEDTSDKETKSKVIKSTNSQQLNTVDIKASSSTTRSWRGKNLIDSDLKQSKGSEIITVNNIPSKQESDSKAIQSKYAKLEIRINEQIKKPQIKTVKDSDSEQSETPDVQVNSRSRTRRMKQVEDSNAEQWDDAKPPKSTRTRAKRGQSKNQSTDSTVISESTDNETEKLSSSTNKITAPLPAKHPRKRAIPANKNVIKANAEESDIAIVVKSTRTRSEKSKTKNQSTESMVVSESSDNEAQKKSSATKKITASRPARQPRKRTAPTNIHVIEASSSEESQEIADILKNSVDSNALSSRSRRGVNKSHLSSSEEIPNSDDNKSNSDDIFEKPRGRVKRAKLNKSSKNKSGVHHDVKDEIDTKITDSSKSISMPKRKVSTISNQSDLASPSSKRRSSLSMKGSSHKVLFTGEKSEVHRQIVTKLGGIETEDPAKCSILVTDKVRRTFKFMCSLAHGIPIVSVKWLDDSNKAHRFLDWEDYILEDRIAETKFKFKLKESLKKASEQKLLEGYSVLFTPHLTQPPVAELKEMILSSGGKPLLRAPAKWTEKTIVVTTKDDLQSAKKFLAKAPKSVSIYSTEFVLTGILRQNINLQEFKLEL